MATHIEYDQWMRQDEEYSESVKAKILNTTQSKEKKNNNNSKLSEKSQDLFDELFGDKK